ncbi:MAG TPA: YezD family protein [Candidatus Binataceae bacterium]
MKAEPPGQKHFDAPAQSIATHAATAPRAATEEVLERIRAALNAVRFGSIEVIVQDSRVVQIERKEKFRFDRPSRV